MYNVANSFFIQPDGSLTDKATEENKEQWKKCGEHSGFPQCCIDFFCGDKWISGNNYEFIANYHEQIAAKYGANGVGYIPCPDCLKSGNIVEVKKCNCGQKSKISLESLAKKYLEEYNKCL